LVFSNIRSNPLHSLKENSTQRHKMPKHFPLKKRTSILILKYLFFIFIVKKIKIKINFFTKLNYLNKTKKLIRLKSATSEFQKFYQTQQTTQKLP
jgi:hypothetical protein